MNILFVSNVCSYEEYCYVQSIKHDQKLNPSQKYFDMLVQGLIALPDVKVTCLTARSIAPSTSDVEFLEEKTEIVSEKLRYQYIKVPNRPIIRNLSNMVQGYKWARKIKKELPGDEAFVLIGDPLAYDITFGAVCAMMGKKVKKNAVITDLPFFMHQIQKNSNDGGVKAKIKTAFMNWLIDQFDSFCFLTESMNRINRKKKPYVVIEGMMYNSDERIASNHVENNTVVYAGGLFEQFGILDLVEAAKMVRVPGFQLHLYGEGTCIAAIKSASEEYPYIRYMGTRSLKEIVEVEKNAKLLINPRPSEERFTEYSFPSKTIEYMATARPVLTTKLKGIPEEYFQYLYTIEDESPKGICSAIEMCLNREVCQLDKQGRMAQQFLKENKTNIAQAKRLLGVFRGD